MKQYWLNGKISKQEKIEEIKYLRTNKVILRDSVEDIFDSNFPLVIVKNKEILEARLCRSITASACASQAKRIISFDKFKIEFEERQR